MQRRKVTLAAATVGVLGGAAGLVLLAVPTGAGAAPSLPDISAQELVQSALEAEQPAFGGTVEIDNSLGLPPVPSVPELADGTTQIQTWSDGDGRSRIALPQGDNEKTFVNDGTTAWVWDSATGTVTKSPSDNADEQTLPEGVPSDPAAQAQELLAAVQDSSTVSVSGTATVADRPAYELVLTPKPTERTLLREMRVAVDSETRMPLRVSVYANNITEPVVEVGFSTIEVGPQDPSLFTFTPPEGATVEEHTGEEPPADPADPAQSAGDTVVGDGWDSVIVATVPAEAVADAGQGDSPGDGPGEGPGDGQNLQSILQQVGTPVSGTWGDGWLIQTNAAAAVVTSDGRVAVGAVPQEVLIEALSK